MAQARRIILALWLIAGIASGDVVYLKSGKRYEGQVTRKGDKVFVKMKLATLSFDANDVISIRKTAPKTEPSLPPVPSSPRPPRPGNTFSIGEATRPEPIAYISMRNLAALPAGAEREQARTQWERWRADAHDRKRKIGPDWVAPREFVRRRKAYEQFVREAQQHLRKIRRTVRGKENDKDKAENRAALTAGLSLLHRAATSWCDPLLRRFLLGIVAQERGLHAKAEDHFRQCCQDAPRVAMFHQARAMALAGLGRPLDALQEAMTVFRLRPGTKEGFAVLDAAMKKVPGERTKSTQYKEAGEMLSAYDRDSLKRRSTSRGTVWLSPGRNWTVRDAGLPIPTMDRLEFLQAVGVPVGPHALLVDAAAVGDAQRVFVQVGPKTLAAGTVQRTGYVKEGKAHKLALVTVAEFEFTPVAAGEEEKRSSSSRRPGKNKAPTTRSAKDKDKAPAASASDAADPAPAWTKGQAVTAHAVGIYEQMGSRVRKVKGKVLEIAPEGVPTAISAKLLAGEGAGMVLAEDGRLVGVLMGKTDVAVLNGGPDELIPLPELAKLLKRAMSASPGRGRGVKRTAPPEPVAGQVFVVYGTIGEKFEE